MLRILEHQRSNTGTSQHDDCSDGDAAMCSNGQCQNEVRTDSGKHYSCICSANYYISDVSTNPACDASCAVCPIGKYRKDCGGPNFSESSGTCASCTNLPLNHRWSTSGGNSDSCDSVPCANNCGIGRYRANCGNDETQTSQGECKDCTGLREDYYWTSSGPYLDRCESLPCPACNAEGTFRFGCGGHSNGNCISCTSHTSCNADEYIEGCSYTSPGECTWYSSAKRENFNHVTHFNTHLVVQKYSNTNLLV